MRLQLSVVLRPPDGATTPSGPLEVEVEAAAGSVARELARTLLHAVSSLSCSTSGDRSCSTAGDRSCSTSGDTSSGALDPSLLDADEPTLWVRGVPVPGDAPVGQSPLLDGAAVSVTPRRPRAKTTRASQRTPVALAVAHGPDCGRTVELCPGVHTVGRSAEATIRLDDPRMSRLHAAVTVTADRITLEDLGSSNGTTVDGAPAGAAPLDLVVGATICLGDTLLVLRPTGAVPAAVSARLDGTRAVNRRPRLLDTPTPGSIALPTPPAPPRSTRTPWVALVLPIPFAAAMALFFGPLMLAFALMSPLLMAGTSLSDRLGSKRTYAAEKAAYEGHLGAAHERVSAACAEEARTLRRSLPDPSQTLAIATMPTARLWERRRGDHDALSVSIGRCTRPASLRVIRPQGEEGPEHPALEQVPCSLALATIGVLGFCGHRDAAMDVLRSVLGQLAALHSPLDLDLVLVAGSQRADERWAWLGRLPHVRSPDGSPGDWVTALDDGSTAARACVVDLAQRVRARRSSATPAVPWSGPRTVVILDGASALRGLPDLAEVLEHGPSVGICVLALHGDRAELPSEAGAVLDLTTPSHPSLHLPNGVATDLVVNRVGPWWADRLSRGLAPLRDASPGEVADGLPSSLGLADLLAAEIAERGHDGRGGPGRKVGLSERGRSERLDAAAVTRLWVASPHATAVPVGLTTDGTFAIDLAVDGPHVLVAGTTGAGKSELLRTTVASLAVHNRPEHLSLVLIDYKGGAAFRECEALPHVAGVVTDLDDHLADRALTSLTAELKRRERLLAAAEVAEFVGYQSGPASRSDPLARLVIVIDEFRALAEELPQFIDGMVRVAALGRSLGVHVILATQRPAGVVTADIKANVNLRIALRVRDRADSDDVLDAPDAAGLDRAVPGRGYARSGGGRLALFQSAHAGGLSRTAEPRGIRARLVEWDRRPAPWPESPTDRDTAATDLTVVVGVVAEAARLVGARPAPTPWLPALPTRLAAEALPARASAFRFPIGMADEPAEQRRRPLEVRLDEPGHWGFVGASGSGRSSTLLTVATMATAALDATRLHVYAVSGGSLSRLESSPQCGAHVGWDDLPRLERLVNRLSVDVTERRRRLAASGHATMGDWWRADDDAAPPALLVVVDDWDVLAQRTDDIPHATLVERLLGLFAEGAGVGLTAAVAGERALLIGRAASALTHRVLLSLTDRADAVLAGLPVKALPAVQAAGRGVLLDGTEIQVAMPSTDRLFSTVAPPTGPGRAQAGGHPWRVDALPDLVVADSLPESKEDPDHAICLGVGGDDLAPLRLSPDRDGRRWIVSGSNGSGVTTALKLIANDTLRRDRPLAVVATRPGPWDILRQDPRITWCENPSEPGELVTLRQAVPSLVMLVDNADELLDSPVEMALRSMAAAVDRDGGLIVAGANAGALSVQYRGLAVDLARHRTGILLGPASLTETEVFGLRVPVDRAAVPGRGYLVRGGVATPLQVAVSSAET